MWVRMATTLSRSAREPERKQWSARRTTLAYSDEPEAARGFVTCAKGPFARRGGL